MVKKLLSFDKVRQRLRVYLKSPNRPIRKCKTLCPLFFSKKINCGCNSDRYGYPPSWHTVRAKFFHKTNNCYPIKQTTCIGISIDSGCSLQPIECQSFYWVYFNAIWKHFVKIVKSRVTKVHKLHNKAIQQNKPKKYKYRSYWKQNTRWRWHIPTRTHTRTFAFWHFNTYVVRDTCELIRIIPNYELYACLVCKRERNTGNRRRNRRRNTTIVVEFLSLDSSRGMHRST